MLSSCPQSCRDFDELLPLARSDCIYPKRGAVVAIGNFFLGDSISGSVVGFTSSWIDCDSKNPQVSLVSQHCLRKELAWALHLGLPAIQVSLKHASNIKLAHVIAAFIKSEVAPFKVCCCFLTTFLLRFGCLRRCV